jgi:glycosyltransferase involved in cell wall biosynthesis
MFNLISLLEKNGHEVIPFSIRYNKNLPTLYSKYFVSPLSNEDEVYFKEQSKNLKSIYKSITRVFYSKEVYNKLKELVVNEEPEFAIVLHYQRKLSLSVIKLLNDFKIPFIVRISDFAMICPNAHLFRNGKICEKCIHDGLFNSIKYNCVQNSKIASFINYLSLLYQRITKFYDNIPYFIVPSQFTINKHIEAGFEKKKFFHLPTFVNSFSENPNFNRTNNILYFGRIHRTKGLHVLLEAANILKGELDFVINIFGTGDMIYEKELKEFCINNDLKMVSFNGFCEKEVIYDYIQKAKVSVIPSLWFENQPNSLLESLAHGTPVIASNLGSLKELVIENETGYLFEPGNSFDLAQKIIKLFDNFNRINFIQNSIKFVKKYHSEIEHYNKLMQVYNHLRKD